MSDAMQTIDEAVAPDDKKISSHSAAPSAGGRASVELKQGVSAGEAGEAGEAEVAASAPKRKRAPTATPRKKKVVAEETSPVVEPATPRHSVSIENPLFFAGLNVVHRKMQQDARRTKLSSLPIV